jgi:hypothetical protein
MITLIVVAILLTINMFLMHLDKIALVYYWVYKKIIKPKFEIGELVLINGIEFEVLLLTKNHRPYTYFCLPTSKTYSRMIEAYYYESEIKKKTGLLKELE